MSTEKLPKKITRKSSKQAYWIIKLLSDKYLTADAYRAYSYFRWLDDVIDVSNLKRSQIKRIIKRQESIIARAFRKEKLPLPLSPEEQIIVDLIKSIDKPGSKLENYIRNI